MILRVVREDAGFSGWPWSKRFAVWNSSRSLRSAQPVLPCACRNAVQAIVYSLCIVVRTGLFFAPAPDGRLIVSCPAMSALRPATRGLCAQRNCGRHSNHEKDTYHRVRPLREPVEITAIAPTSRCVVLRVHKLFDAGAHTPATTRAADAASANPRCWCSGRRPSMMVHDPRRDPRDATARPTTRRRWGEKGA
jgi:hypothetical protein